jgi:hypothetical protein
VYFKSFADHLSETCNCWKGYKRKPGTAPCAEGSCIKEGKRGLWDNIHAKQKRIKAGSGEKMRKPGSEGAPTDTALKASQNEEIKEGAFSSGALKATEKFKREAAKIPSTGTIRAKDKQGSYTAKTVNHKEVSRVYDTKEEVEAQFDLIESVVT